MIRRRSGFTLLELIVVVTMLGVLAGLVASSLSRSSAESRLNAASREIVVRLAVARATALESGVPVVATLGSNEDASITLSTDPEKPDAHAWALPSQGPPRFVVDGADPSPGARVLFQPTGRASVRRIRAIEARTGGTIMAIEFDPISGDPRLESRQTDEQGGAP